MDKIFYFVGKQAPPPNRSLSVSNQLCHGFGQKSPDFVKGVFLEKEFKKV
jgi:hypothetical protein